MASSTCFTFSKLVTVLLFICFLVTCCVISSFFGILLILIFIVIPVVFRYSPSLQRGMIFLNYVRYPDNNNYNPEAYGMSGTKNFHITTKDNITLGVWHILPSKLYQQNEQEPKNYEQLLGHGEPIIIYMHGNAGTRANEHRVMLYKVLQNIDCHVIAVDYRSYADSTDDTVSETGVVNDVMEVFRWVHSRANDSPIYGWGHSLGTGISSHAFSLLEREGLFSKGLVLEAPFTKISEEIREYPLAKIYRILPWFDYFFIDPVFENGIVFDTEENLKTTKMPILIFHARDDVVVPYKLGEKLYNYLMKYRANFTYAELVLYDSHLKYNHKFICKDKDLGKKVKKFINSTQA